MIAVIGDEKEIAALILTLQERYMKKDVIEELTEEFGTPENMARILAENAKKRQEQYKQS